ncbi:tRNA (adenosine(37)-N6)-threonylcarbamoyltransferase complex dimerization subunit type 1 TsaB [Trichococcus ilyis]|jgi:tRNA threonylcarbamoyladenosine biosynthesis protein TsaB|uniref:Trna threonylcarbamoyl adenosine modification protein yeaz n=1 Tax=Trichococcus ilyis TaxID=640938 RepID=A0A143YA14_9LACT|nr:tRNA (adenosine(37)-N6)-threonylcarbamoyltransferase complex dimerization subunit type 1 TsaB [Trichococcus ilyis]CZQ83614.1 trna threonylcarbamoyl adenosine modification protein yeaz [Trichococcus ilyis]SEJ33380.1 tRNA threonylcarbamoyladenosine biosynthesis protein TsaB [Trichococcus ilyis]
MKILAIESSNQTMSAAVCENGRLIAEVTTNGNLQHSTQLMPAVDHVIRLAGWKPADLERIAVAKGPGSYTGVRIGATIAKTLAWTLALPLVPVSSLKVLAGNCEGAAEKIVPMIDARRGNCYTAVYQFEDGLLVERTADLHTASEDWFQRLLAEEGTYLFVGEDVSKYRERIGELFKGRALFAGESQDLPRASVLAALSDSGAAEDPHTFVPAYLKNPEAEEKWEEKHHSNRREDYVERVDASI